MSTAEMHTDQAVSELEQERTLLEQMRQQLLRTVAQLQVEESDLLAQMTALSAPTGTASLREKLHAELFGSNQPAPPPQEARSILDTLIASPAADGAGGEGEDSDEEEEEDQRWFQTQQSLRGLEGGQYS